MSVSLWFYTIFEIQKLEFVLNDVNGLLAILYEEEKAGLQQTSLRIEVNALESLARKMTQLGYKRCQ